MPFHIIHQDITRMDCDAIVNPTDKWLSGSGGTDYAVHEAAGEGLDEICQKIADLQVGTVAVTDGYRLPCRYIFHTVGPIWHGGSNNEDGLLRSCYLSSLLKAKKMNLSSIAFPLISSGTFGFPKDRVLRIAIDAISDFLYTADSEFQVYVCILDRRSFEISKEVALNAYLQEGSRRFIYEQHTLKMYSSPEPFEEVCCEPSPIPELSVPVVSEPSTPLGAAVIPTVEKMQAPVDLAAWIEQQDDSFAVLLLKLIEQKGMTDVQCYKKANVTKGTFWKINNDPKYRPSKATVIAFAIALELDMQETENLLRTVGFSLSNSNTFDKIIQFYILNGTYDIFEINAALFRYDQACLGC